MAYNAKTSTIRFPAALLWLIAVALAINCAECWCAAWAQTPEPGVEQLWQRAAQAQQGHEYLRAASLYRNILSLRPEFTEAEVNLCLMLQLSGNLPEARNCFDHVSAKHPELFVPNFLAGMDSLKLGDVERALPFLKKAVRQAPDKTEARLGLGNAYLQGKEYSEAREEFLRVTKIEPGNAEAWYGLGATYLSIQKELETELRRSESPFRAVLLAESYLQQGKTEKAVATLFNVAARASALPCIHSLLGFAYLEQSKTDEAAQQFGRDWNAASEEGCLLAKLGMVSLAARRSRPVEALHYLREAMAIDAGAVIANQELFEPSITAAGANADAREILDNGNQPPTQETSDNPGVDMRHGRYSLCSSLLAGATREPDVAGLRLISMCSYYAGQDERVMTATEHLLKRAAGDPEALYWRIQASERLGMAAITTASTLSPNAPSLHVLMGDMLQEKGDLAEAAREYRKALAAKADFLAAHIALARVLNSDHRPDEAENEVRFVLSASPSDAEANYLMGEILVNRSEFAEALPFLLKAEHASADELPFVHADLSLVFEERGDVDKAIAEMKQALSVDVDGSYHYRLGHLYLKIGDRSSARQYLRAAETLRRQADAGALFERSPQSN